MAEKDAEGKLGFLDSVGRLFRSRDEKTEASRSEAKDAFGALGADFDSAIRRLQEIASQNVKSELAAPDATRTKQVDRASESRRRKEELQRAIRTDIEKMHAKLGTGLTTAALDAIQADLVELAATAGAGRESQELLPRMRHAIVARLQAESGELAVTRIVTLLERAKLSWPDPTRYQATATPEEIERSRRRRLAEVRENFLVQDLKRTSERMWGIVQTWGSDYPDRGSPLWEETVMEGVAAGIRGALVKDFVEALQSDRDELLRRAESSIGKALAALHEAVKGGVRSLDDANKAVASSLQVLDHVVPELAWEQVKAKLPQARGEFPS